MVSSASEKPVSQSESAAGVPLCIHCKWYKRSWLPKFWDPHYFATCRRPIGFRKTDGSAIHNDSFADVERIDGGKDCGSRGRYFSPAVLSDQTDNSTVADEK